eukprot:8472107-Lingulodinium_polyedra.AAC.1
MRLVKNRLVELGVVTESIELAEQKKILVGGWGAGIVRLRRAGSVRRLFERSSGSLLMKCAEKWEECSLDLRLAELLAEINYG